MIILQLCDTDGARVYGTYSVSVPSIFEQADLFACLRSPDGTVRGALTGGLKTAGGGSAVDAKTTWDSYLSANLTATMELQTEELKGGSVSRAKKLGVTKAQLDEFVGAMDVVVELHVCLPTGTYPSGVANNACGVRVWPRTATSPPIVQCFIDKHNIRALFPDEGETRARRPEEQPVPLLWWMRKAKLL